MKRYRRVAQWARPASLLLPLALIVSCGGGPGTVGGPATGGGTTPLADEATLLVFGYETKHNVDEASVRESLKPLGNTNWLVTSINPKPAKPYASTIFRFRPDGNLVETTVYEDRSEESRTFPYHVIGSTLLIDKPKGEVNARFKMQGELLVIDTGDASILLQRMKTR